MNNTVQRGKWGEQVALDYLQGKGFQKVFENFHSRFGEIDLIVKNHEYLVFVEVKLRKNPNFAHAREAVDYHKQKKLRSAANLWLSARETELQPRFDVIEIYSEDRATEPKIVHIENAF